jgi:hypothetical protein
MNSRELRHGFVSMLSDADVPQNRPMIMHGADVMDRIFPGDADHDAELLS